MLMTALLGLVTDLCTLPPPDAVGRHATLNHYGYCDPHKNEITEAFVKWAVEKTKKSGSRTQKHVLEVGSAFGFIAREAVGHGAHYLMNDLSEEHLRIARDNLPEGVAEAQVQTFAGRFPDQVDQFQNLKNHRIIGAGSFMVLHFLSGAEIEAFFDTLHGLLLPGARVFVTAATPYNRLFKGFPPEFARRKARFVRDPSKGYPGEIEDAWKYLNPEQYPRFFHALDADVLTHAATRESTTRFRIVQALAIQRPNPPQQAYRRGYPRGQTEIVGLILEKPAD